MSDARPSTGRESPRGDLFDRCVELVDILETGEGDPEALLERHPALAADLSAVRESWRRLDAFFHAVGPGSSSGRSGAAGADALDRRSRTILERLASAHDFPSRYAVDEEIGRGGMGVVRRVRDRVLGRELALKQFAEDERQEGRRLRRFLEEASRLGRLEHPGILPLHELGLDGDGRVYFTMPLVRGESFAEVLRKARDGEEGRSLPGLLEVLLKICDALAYAHSRGVVHRDLKPANVLVGRFGEVFVVDWGLALDLEAPEAGDGEDEEAGADPRAPLTLEGEVLGTPAYMAPEQAEGRHGRADARADVYALGAMLYEILSGCRPYATPTNEPTSKETIAALRRGPPVNIEALAAETPAELASITRRAIARSPEDRYESVPAFAEELRAYLEGRVVASHERGAWAEARKWVRRNRGLAGALAGLVVALMAGLVVALVLLDRARTERTNVLRLSAFQDLDDLRTEAEQLWPAVPEHVPAYERWLDAAAKLVRRLDPDRASRDPGLRATVADLEARSRSGSQQDRWWHAQIVRLVHELDSFADPETGLIAGVSPGHGWGIARRREFAATLEERSLTGPEAKARWAEAVSSVADVSRCSAYGGLLLEPIVGLLPLGPDPRSGLWEFAHLQSGEPAVRDEAGELRLTEETGIVLVLLPGGAFAMGAQATDPAALNYDPWAQPIEAPVHAVTLEPFLLSKYEVTQAQWLRATGTNPSFYNPTNVLRKKPITLLHPVEWVSWEECDQMLRRMGLGLPSEEEWEYAARAGTTTPFWTGELCESLAGAANISDDAERIRARALQAPCGMPDDGWPAHAPVGSLLANDFGLRDMAGNVLEWCRDSCVVYGTTAPLFDSRRAGLPDLPQRAIRGGSHDQDWTSARSAARSERLIDYRRDANGARPARNLEL